MSTTYTFTIIDWIVGTSILLATPIIPFAIRKWIVKRPLGKVVAGTISFGIWIGLFSFFWWAASLVDLQDWYSRKPHLGVLAVAAISYWMLTRPGRDVARRANDESSDDKTGLRIETRETPQQDSGRATEATQRSHAIQSSARANPNRANWRRGLFRLWVFVSVLWSVFWGIMLVVEGGSADPEILVLVFGAPVLLLALGATTIWVVHGFGRKFGDKQTTGPATNHQQFRRRRAFIVIILMVATMAITIAVYEVKNSYENCILRNMQGAPANAVALIRDSCRRIAR